MQPKMLVLDEPAAGLDPRGRKEILGRLTQYRREGENSLVVISHSMEDVAEFSDRIIAMDDGKILCEGTPCEVFSHAEELKNSGLALPRITEIMRSVSDMAKQAGISLPNGAETAFTVDAAYKYLSELLPSRKGETLC
jgi:energy-coupling factor transport system ATP-binding protein